MTNTTQPQATRTEFAEADRPTVAVVTRQNGRLSLACGHVRLESPGLAYRDTVTCFECDSARLKAAVKTIYVQVWIESPDADMTPSEMETAIKTAILRSDRICRAIEINKIECDVDMDARDTKLEAA